MCKCKNKLIGLSFLIVCSAILSKGVAQTLTIPNEYILHIKVADSLFNAGLYKNSASFYSKAFESFNWRGTREDRFKAARAFNLSNQVDSAFFNLNKLCTLHFWNYKLLENDKAFSSLKNTIEWDQILNCIKENKNKDAPSINIDWYNFLDTIFNADVKIRRDIMSAEANHEDTKQLYNKMKFIDSINLIKVLNFIDTFGWRGPDEIGRQGSEALFLVIQHSNTKTQERYFPILKDAVNKGKASPQSLALMEDRISVAKNGYQIYGSQLYLDSSGKYKVSPIKDEKNVNLRRKEVGLQPIEEYLKIYYQIEYKPVIK